MSISYRQREKNKYISLQEAAEVLSNSVKNILSKEWIDSVTPINRSDPFDEFEYKRSNPDKIHKETLPKITIGLINLTLHICNKNNVKVYGKRPSFSDRIMIPFEEIQFFSADRTRLYSDRSRDAATLIYSDVAVMKKDFEYAINNTDDAEFGQIVYAL